MRLLVISSSPHKEGSQTLLLAKEALRGCTHSRGKIEGEVLHLCDLKIEFCRHCEGCHKNILACPIEDDVGMVLEKMLEADGIIFASPNYINQITASMKAFWDRSAHFIHCLRLLNKYVVGVVSSGSGRDKEVLRYIRHYANICGAQYSGGVSSQAPISKDKKKVAFQLGSKLVSDIKGKVRYPAEVKAINEARDHFKRVILARKDEWEGEYFYWRDKGWL